MHLILQQEDPQSRSHAPRGNAVPDARRRLGLRTRSVPDGIPTRSVGTRGRSFCWRISHRSSRVSFLRPFAQRDLELDLLAVAPDEDIDGVAGLVAAEALGVVVDGRDRLAAEADDDVVGFQAPLLGGAPL